MTCERCHERPVRVTIEADGFSIAMLPTGHLVCDECNTRAEREHLSGGSTPEED